MAEEIGAMAPGLMPRHAELRLERAHVDGAIDRVRARNPFPDVTEMAVLAYREVATTVSRYLEPGAAILDFGAGICDKSALLQWLGFSCTAVDDFETAWYKQDDGLQKIEDFAEAAGVHLRIVNAGPLPFPPDSFDMVMMHDVLEHLHDSPRALVNNLVELLRPGGYLFVTVPNLANIRKRVALGIGRTNLPAFEAFYWSETPWRGHVREYVRGDLVKLCQFLRLRQLELRSFHQMLHKLPAVSRPMFRLATRLFRGWRDSWLLVAQKPAEWTPRRNVPPDELERLMGNRPRHQW